MQKQPPQSNATAPVAPSRTVTAPRVPGRDVAGAAVPTTGSPGRGHHFGRVRVRTAAPKAGRAKLKVNRPGDGYEQEATRIADRVMADPAPETHPPGGRRSQHGLTGRAEDRDVGVRARTPQGAATGELEVSPGLTNRLDQREHEGDPLPDALRDFYEPRMRYDFGQVRIHKDDEAARISQQLGARAFTHGRSIYFGPGQYDPRLAEGRRLIAHELAHVTQQGGGRRGLVQRVPVAAPALGAAEWIALGTAGYEITQNAVNQTAGDISYSFDEMEGVILPGGSTSVEDYRKQHPGTAVRSYTHTVSVWHGTSDSRKAGIKFGIDFNYDGNALGNISMRILDTYDWPMWSGAVNVNLTALSLATGGAAAVRITINVNADVTLRGGQVSSLVLELDGRSLLKDVTGPHPKPYFKFSE